MQCHQQFSETRAHSASPLLDDGTPRSSNGHKARTAIAGVDHAPNDSAALQPLDQLSHRRLADTHGGSERRQPGRPLGIQSMQGVRCGDTESTSVREFPDDQRGRLLQSGRNSLNPVMRRCHVSEQYIICLSIGCLTGHVIRSPTKPNQREGDAKCLLGLLYGGTGISELRY
jgi:hypothetical protein